MEATILESLRAGHSIRAACAAAGVAERTYHRFATNSQAHRHDREVAQQEAERRLVGRVLDAADGGDVKSAMWLLERRWPAVHGAPLRIDAKIEGHHDIDLEVVALAERYSGLTDEEVGAEIKRLAWAVPATEQPGTAPGDGRGGLPSTVRLSPPSRSCPAHATRRPTSPRRPRRQQISRKRGPTGNSARLNRPRRCRIWR